MRWDRPWLRYLIAAVAYGAGYGFLHIFWMSHWELTAGLRLACLLLVPPRYWPALLIGEAAALGKIAYSCGGTLGMPWALTFPFAFMVAAMPVVWLFRKYWPVVDANKHVTISSMLWCILAVTLASTAANTFEYALMQGLSPDKSWSAAHVGFFSYLWFLGAGLGIYMIVPLVLWAYSGGDLHLRDIGMRIVRSRVLLEAFALFVPCLCALAHTVEYSDSSLLRHAAQAAMLLAPGWLALRYGWRGASMGSMLANLAVVLSMPALYDPATLQTQELMLASSTLWIMLGTRVSVFRVRLKAAH